MNFLFSCIGLSRKASEEFQTAMDNSIEVTCNTFKRVLGVEGFRELEEQFGYDKHLRLRDDFCVRFYRTKLQGKRIYVMRHSAIEYVYG